MKIVQATGQTCNQFWIYSNFIADSINENGKIVILAPDISIRDFPNMLNNEFIIYPFFDAKIANFFGYYGYIKFLNFLFANRYSKIILKYLSKIIPGIEFIPAGVDCPKSIYRLIEKERLKHIYTPGNFIIEPVKKIFLDARQHFDIFVGIHIRLGDYRTYLNGKYYYKLEQYQSIMRHLIFLFKWKYLPNFML